MRSLNMTVQEAATLVNEGAVVRIDATLKAASDALAAKLNGRKIEDATLEGQADHLTGIVLRLSDDSIITLRVRHDHSLSIICKDPPR
jgi:hypothetical protein